MPLKCANRCFFFFSSSLFISVHTYRIGSSKIFTQRRCVSSSIALEPFVYQERPNPEKKLRRVMFHDILIAWIISSSSSHKSTIEESGQLGQGCGRDWKRGEIHNVKRPWIDLFAHFFFFKIETPFAVLSEDNEEIIQSNFAKASKTREKSVSLNGVSRFSFVLLRNLLQ